MKQEQPHIIEAEYYPDGNQKRYYKKVEQPYPQVFHLIIALCAIAISLCTLTITYQLSQPSHCQINVVQKAEVRRQKAEGNPRLKTWD